MNRRERRAAGRESQKPSNRSGVSTPAALYGLADRHRQAGRSLDAQLCCQQALAVDANHADSLYLLGLLSLQAQQYDHAIEWTARAIRSDPRANYLSTLAKALLRSGRIEEALKTVEKTISLEPD